MTSILPPGPGPVRVPGTKQSGLSFVERIIVGSLASRLLMHALDKNRTIVVDSDRGYDPDAKSFQPRAGISNDQLNAMVDEFVDECGEYDEVHVFVDDEILDDEGYPEEGHGPWVYLIFGNGNGGWDVITDYSISLEDVIQPVVDFAASEGL